MRNSVLEEITVRRLVDITMEVILMRNLMVEHLE